MKELRRLIRTMTNKPLSYIKKIITNLPNLKQRLAKSKTAKIITPIFLGIILFLLLAPLLLDNSYLKFEIAQKFSKVSGFNLQIRGDVKVKLLPSPHIIMEDILLQNYRSKTSKQVYNFYAKSAKVKISLYNSKIKKLTLEEPTLERYFDSDKVTKRKNKLSEIISEITKDPIIENKSLKPGISSKLIAIDKINKTQFRVKNLPNIIINNGHLIIYDKLEKLKELQITKLNSKINKDKIVINGNFKSEDIISDFEGLFNFNSKSKKPDSYFDLSSPLTQIHLEGNFTSANKGLKSNFKGKLAAEIQELKTFYKTYIDKNDIIYHKIKYNHNPLKISANINNNRGILAINDINLQSMMINGSGTITSDFSQKIPLIDIIFKIQDFDLDALLSKEPLAITLPKTIKSELQNLPDDMVGSILPIKQESKNDKSSLIDNKKNAKKLVKFNLSNQNKNFDLTTEIDIKNTKYLGGIIRDTNIYLTVSNSGKVMILPMIFKIPGKGDFRLNGTFDNSFGLPKFIGEFDFKGESLEDLLKWLKIESQNLKFDHLNEYEAHSDLLLVPNEVNLNNFYLNLNKGNSEFLGKVKINTSNKIPLIKSDFQINKFDIDHYFLTSGQNIYFSPGSLLRKLLWLNTTNSEKEITARFDKLIYKEEEFINPNLKLKLKHGYLEIEQLNLNSDKTKIEASLILDISSSDPTFYLKVNGSDFNYISQIPENEKLITIKQKFSDQFFALPSLDGFNGIINLNFDNLNLEGLIINDAKLLGKLRNGTLPETNISGNIFGGKLQYNGSLALKLNKTINGSLSLNEVDLAELLSTTLNINNISGISNIAASISSSASNKNDFISKLVSHIKFNTNSPKISSYGLSDLISKMASPRTYGADLRQPENILTNNNAITIFNQASGTINIAGKKNGKINVKVKAPAMNGILSGSINLANNTANMLFNSIFLTGTIQNTIPINIATNISGKIDNLSTSSNIDQVRQYLGLPKVNNNSNLDKKPLSVPKNKVIKKIPAQ